MHCAWPSGLLFDQTTRESSACGRFTRHAGRGRDGPVPHLPAAAQQAPVQTSQALLHTLPTGQRCLYILHKLVGHMVYRRATFSCHPCAKHINVSFAFGDTCESRSLCTVLQLMGPARIADLVTAESNSEDWLWKTVRKGVAPAFAPQALRSDAKQTCRHERLCIWA